MASTITHHLNDRSVRELLHGTHGAVARDMYRRGQRVKTRAQQLCPVDTGRLRASIYVHVVVVHGEPSVEVGTKVNYARYVMRGTGLYGPHHHVIVPTHGKVLVFRPRGSANVVFARSVKGSPPHPFLQLALLAARD
jgi:Bacteriophage HK97-gp10, putative tail-component